MKKVRLFSESTILNRIYYLSKEISKDYYDNDLVIICVLKGSYMFFTYIVSQLKIKNDPEIDFIQLSSYSVTESTGQIKIKKDIDIDVNNKDVLIIEDIVDTGLTMKYLIDHLNKKNCKSIKVCSLLQKPSKMKSDVYVDYLGFVIEDDFVVGFGLDHDEKYRTLPEIFKLIPENSLN